MPSDRTRLILKTAAATLLAAALLAAAAGYIVFRAGWYNIGAISSHLQPVFEFLEQGMRESVSFHSRDVKVPNQLASAQRIAAGGPIFHANCAHCHGAPGFAPSDHGQAMQPVPGPLVAAAETWTPAELYWITRHGIKMSGMPAWEFHLDEDEIWAVVAFMQRLPQLTPAAYREVVGIPAAPVAPVLAVSAAVPLGAGPVLQADVARGRIALSQYACQACHIVPGVTGPKVYVGPSLDGLARRKFIAGAMPNTPENLVRWILDPQAIDPHNVMPVMGVTERDARDMAAYLLSL